MEYSGVLRSLHAKDIVYNQEEDLFAAVGAAVGRWDHPTSADGKHGVKWQVSVRLPMLASGRLGPGCWVYCRRRGGVISFPRDGADWSALGIGNGRKVIQIEGNVVAGSLLGVVNPCSAFITLADLNEGKCSQLLLKMKKGISMRPEPGQFSLSMTETIGLIQLLNVLLI